MTERRIEIEADTLDEARAQLRAQIPSGLFLLAEQVLSDGTPRLARAFAQTIEEALAKAESEVPRQAVVIEKRQLSIPEQRAITVQARDQANAESVAREQLSFGMELKGIELKAMGKKGFLGLGNVLNQYEARVLQQPFVEITYKEKVRISATLGDRSACVNRYCTVRSEAVQVVNNPNTGKDVCLTHGQDSLRKDLPEDEQRQILIQCRQANCQFSIDCQAMVIMAEQFQQPPKELRDPTTELVSATQVVAGAPNSVMVCDICDKVIGQEESYLLNTDEVLASDAYVDFVIRGWVQQGFIPASTIANGIGNHLREPARNDIRRQGGGTPWRVCATCLPIFRPARAEQPQAKPLVDQSSQGAQQETIISFSQYGSYFTELARSLQTTNPDDVFAHHVAFCANCGIQFSREALTHLHLFGPGSEFEGNLSVMGATTAGNDIRSVQMPWLWTDTNARCQVIEGLMSNAIMPMPL